VIFFFVIIEIPALIQLSTTLVLYTWYATAAVGMRPLAKSQPPTSQGTVFRPHLHLWTSRHYIRAVRQNYWNQWIIWDEFL